MMIFFRQSGSVEIDRDMISKTTARNLRVAALSFTLFFSTSSLNQQYAPYYAVVVDIILFGMCVGTLAAAVYAQVTKEIIYYAHVRRWRLSSVIAPSDRMCTFHFFKRFLFGFRLTATA